MRQKDVDMIQQMIAQAVAQALTQAGVSGRKTGNASQTKSEKKSEKKEMVAYTNKAGVTKNVTAAQAAAWSKFAENKADAAEKREERLVAWQGKREAFQAGKCPKALSDAIKKDRAAVTLKVAKSLGFVGTKSDLKELKAQILG